MTKEELRKYWEQKVLAYKESGKSQRAWCEENGVGLKSLNSWYNKLKKKPSNVQDVGADNWLSVKTSRFETNTTINIRIGKSVIEISKGFDRAVLSDVVKILGDIC